MNAASQSESSKPRKWGSRVLTFAEILCFVLSCALVEVWFLTRDGVVISSFSKNAQHFELHAGAGHVIAIHVSNWWTDNEWEGSGGPVRPNLEPKSWIGFDIESESRFAAFYSANGIYHPPLIDMTNVVITPHFQRGQSLRFRLCLFPIWIPCVVFGLPTVWSGVRRIRRAKRNSSATDLRPEAKPSSGPVPPS